MKRLMLLATAVLAASMPSYGQATVEIALKQGSLPEAQTRDQLQRLLKTYDLTPWIYKTVAERGRDLGVVVRNHKLIPGQR